MKKLLVLLIMGAFASPQSFAAPGMTYIFRVSAPGVAAPPAVPVATPVGRAALSATTQDFGTQYLNTTSAARTITLTNDGSAPLTVSSVVLGAGGGGYVVSNTCGAPLAPGSSCNIAVTFRPTVEGTFPRDILVSTDAASSPSVIALTGVGAPAPVGRVALSATTQDFGTQYLNTTSAPRNVTLTNDGNAPLTVSSVVLGTGAGGYVVSNTCGAPVAPGATCNIAVTFSPTVSGTFPRDITVTTDAATPTSLISLTGVGAPAPDPTPVALLASGFASGGNWASSITVSNSSINAAGTVWTVNARPSGHASKNMSLYSQPTAATGIRYAEVVITTNSSWVGMVGATDGANYGVALDGPGCSRAGTYVGECTTNNLGNWAGRRMGITMNYNTGVLTIQSNGTTVFTQTGVLKTQGYKIWLYDRDNPQSAVQRTFTLHNARSTWLHAPAGVLPFAP